MSNCMNFTRPRRDSKLTRARIYKNHNSRRQAETWPSYLNEMQKVAGGQDQKSTTSRR